MSITTKYSTDVSREMPNYTSSSETDMISKMYGNLNILPPHLISSMSKSSMILPKGYQPSQYDVVCGRGRGHYNQPGNIRFRALISSRLNEYLSLRNKIEKSIFFNKIMNEVRTQNDGNAHFIRQVSYDTWEIVSDDQAREKIGHAIREAIIPRNKQSKSQEVMNDTCLSLSKSITNTPSDSLSGAGITDMKSDILLEYPSTELIRQRTDQIVSNIIALLDNKNQIDIAPDKMLSSTSSSSSTTMITSKTCETNSLLHTNMVSESIITNNIDTTNLICLADNEMSNVNSSCLQLDDSINVTTIVSGDSNNNVCSSMCSSSHNFNSNNNYVAVESQIYKKETKSLDLLLDDYGDDENYLKINKYYDLDIINCNEEEKVDNDVDDATDDDDDLHRRLSGISITCGLKYHSVSVLLAEEYCKINSNYYSDIIQNNSNKQKDDSIDDDDDNVCRRLSGLSVIDGFNLAINMSLNELL